MTWIIGPIGGAERGGAMIAPLPDGVEPYFSNKQAEKPTIPHKITGPRLDRVHGGFRGERHDNLRPTVVHEGFSHIHGVRGAMSSDRHLGESIVFDNVSNRNSSAVGVKEFSISDYTSTFEFINQASANSTAEGSREYTSLSDLSNGLVETLQTEPGVKLLAENIVSLNNADTKSLAKIKAHVGEGFLDPLRDTLKNENLITRTRETADKASTIVLGAVTKLAESTEKNIDNLAGTLANYVNPDEIKGIIADATKNVDPKTADALRLLTIASILATASLSLKKDIRINRKSAVAAITAASIFLASCSTVNVPSISAGVTEVAPTATENSISSADLNMNVANEALVSLVGADYANSNLEIGNQIGVYTNNAEENIPIIIEPLKDGKVDENTQYAFGSAPVVYDSGAHKGEQEGTTPVIIKYDKTTGNKEAAVLDLVSMTDTKTILDELHAREGELQANGFSVEIEKDGDGTRITLINKETNERISLVNPPVKGVPASPTDVPPGIKDKLVSFQTGAQIQSATETPTVVPSATPTLSPTETLVPTPNAPEGIVSTVQKDEITYGLDVDGAARYIYDPASKEWKEFQRPFSVISPEGLTIPPDMLKEIQPDKIKRMQFNGGDLKYGYIWDTDPFPVHQFLNSDGGDITEKRIMTSGYVTGFIPFVNDTGGHMVYDMVVVAIPKEFSTQYIVLNFPEQEDSYSDLFLAPNGDFSKLYNPDVMGKTFKGNSDNFEYLDFKTQQRIRYVDLAQKIFESKGIVGTQVALALDFPNSRYSSYEAFKSDDVSVPLGLSGIDDAVITIAQMTIIPKPLYDTTMGK